jgi:hypothetical protein
MIHSVKTLVLHTCSHGHLSTLERYESDFLCGPLRISVALRKKLINAENAEGRRGLLLKLGQVDNSRVTIPDEELLAAYSGQT